jgi:hypothetical protein
MHVAQGAPLVTPTDVFAHRVDTLEKAVNDQAGIVRGLEREVDRLKIEGAAVITAVAKLEGRLEERDAHLQNSLSRLHERLDERLSAVAPLGEVADLRAQLTKLTADELREQGAVAERGRMWKAWFNITVATVGVLSLIAAIVFGLTQVF